MNIKFMQDMVHEILDTHLGEEYDVAEYSTSTFEDAGLLTSDKGVVVKFVDGKKFNITITEG